MKKEVVHLLLATFAILTLTLLFSGVHAAAAANIDQCINGGVNPLTLEPCRIDSTYSNWVNGNANGQKAHWKEGEFISYRVTVTGITAGPHTLDIHYDTVHSGKHAIDYLGSFDYTETTSTTASAFHANNNNPCLDVLPAAQCDPTAPIDSFLIPAASLINCDASAGTPPTQITGYVKIWGPSGTDLTGVTYLAQDVPSGGGQCSTSVEISFTSGSGGSTVVIAWGGHIASEGEWGSGNSASFISGSPYHMALDKLDGASTGSQDRALATSAIIFTPTITTDIIKNADGSIVTGGSVPIGTTVHDTATLSGASSNAGGQVTYNFFTTIDCTGTPTAETVTVTNAVVPPSSDFTPTQAGPYSYQAAYSGDSRNLAATSVCEPLTVLAKPTISTVLSETTISVGDSVYDTATLSGATSDAGGTVTYTVYTDSSCTLNPVDAGTKTVTNGVVPDSNSIQFNQAGTFYWQAVYSGDANNEGYTAACTEEVLTVNAPGMEITKTADAATVNAGETIGFTITVTNTGPGTATGVSMTDTLPTGTDIVWSIAGTTGGPDCNISSNTLTCTIASLAGNGGSFSVHIASPTTQNSCQVYTNTASVTTTNNGGDETAPVTITVQCSTIIIVKNTVGGDGTFGFTGTGTGGFPASFDVAAVSGTGQQSFTVEPGTYSVSETTLPNSPGNVWALVSAVCDNGSPESGFTAPADGTVTCTFTNQLTVPEYPFGLGLFFIAVAGIYALVRRRIRV